MKLNTYTPEFCAAAVKLVLAQGLTLAPILARSRFHPCPYAEDVRGLRCSTQASRTSGSGNTWQASYSQWTRRTRTEELGRGDRRRGSTVESPRRRAASLAWSGARGDIDRRFAIIYDESACIIRLGWQSDANIGSGTAFCGDRSPMRWRSVHRISSDRRAPEFYRCV